MLSKLKKYKYILLLLVVFIFLPAQIVNATSTCDLSSLTDAQKETIAKCWQYAVENCSSANIDIDNSNYFIVYSELNNICNVYIINKSKNTLRELSYETGTDKKDWFNYFVGFTCPLGGSPSVFWNGYNASNIISSPATRNPVVIANNVYTTNNAYKQISRSYKDVPFLNDEPVVSPFHVEYREESQSFFVVTDFMDFKTCMYTYTGYYNTKGLQTAFYPDTYENYNWTLMDKECSNYENEDGTNDWRYAQEILSYGEYYFCWRNHDTKTHDIYCIKITGSSSSIEKYNEDTFKFDEIEKTDYEQKNYLPSDNTGAENQNFYVKYDNNVATIYSNYLAEDDTYKYDCLFSKDYINYSDDITKEYSDSKIEGYSSYCRFVKDIYENGTYYFRLRKIEKSSGSIISANVYTVVVDGISVNVIGDENTTIDFYKNTNTMQYFRKTLGIVFYPVEMMFDFFNRLENIQTQEPTITVPDIKEPFTDTVFIKGFTFSLNDVLENENIAYVYNIYLYFTDFILYSLLFVFFMKIFKTYSHFDGGVS